jgi:hypothetical protein
MAPDLGHENGEESVDLEPLIFAIATFGPTALFLEVRRRTTRKGSLWNRLMRAEVAPGELTAGLEAARAMADQVDARLGSERDLAD